MVEEKLGGSWRKDSSRESFLRMSITLTYLKAEQKDPEERHKLIT